MRMINFRDIPEQPEAIGNFQRYHTMVENWDFSRGVIQKLRDRLEGRLSDNVVTVALAGSFGRLEGSSFSDADYILIVNEDTEEVVSQDQQQVRTALEELNLELPNKAGVFAAARTMRNLTEGIGNADEAMDLLGKRMLMLLEARPVYRVETFEKCLQDIFDRYADYVRNEPSKEFVFLLNDLIRYFRFICVNYQSTFWRQNENWPIRNLKLRHSRIVMYAGLLFLIGEASKNPNPDKVEWVQDRLRLTPLDRLAYVYKANNDYGFFKVAGLYNVFLSRMSDNDIRSRLTRISYDERYKFAAFSELKANSDALVSELFRFVWMRHGEWSDRFFEYLVF